jgi:hypothetical protein
MLVAAALCLLPATELRAQTAVDPSGHWEGTVQAPNAEVRIEIDLAKTGNGELAGTLATPAQNLKGLALANFAVKGRSVSFQVKGSPGERVFDGALSADGRSLSGDYTQVGYSMPFRLTRTGDARIEPVVRNAPIGKELEGVWNGALDVNGIQRRLVLTMSNLPDGTATGSILSVDEGLEIPITRIAQKASGLTLELDAVGGSYSGALNAEGTELVGTLTQGAASLPLTLRRPAVTR